MNPRELVDHIRSGPSELLLDFPLRFRRRTRSNPCDFNEFLQALQSSETIRTVRCRSHIDLSVTEDQWILLVKTIGNIKGIKVLKLCTYGSRNFRPLQAVAEAINNAQSLSKLDVIVSLGIFPRDPSGQTAFVNALREHTSLQDFFWFDYCNHTQLEAAQNALLDPVLLTLPACPHLRKVIITTKCASADAIKNLLQMRPATDLTELHLFVSLRSEATEAVKAIASAIQLDRNLEHIKLKMENGFTDEAGVALAEALTINNTLRTITLCLPGKARTTAIATFGVPAYVALSAMMRVNTSLVVKLPPFKTGVCRCPARAELL
jgi:hypothetical protein